MISGLLWDEAMAAMPGLTHRPAQDKAFRAVLDALGGESNIVALEGEPGIGKSLLVAPLLRTGRRVIYSARTKTQQRQMRDTTVPLLVRAGLVPEDQVATLFGRSNYLCERRRDISVRELHEKGFSDLADEVAALTVRGDGNREFYPDVSGAAWGRANSDDEQGCTGDCRGDMYAAAKERAAASKLLITNHSIVAIFAMINLRKTLDHSDVLFTGDDVLVLDEAHRMPEVLDDVYAVGISKRWLLQIEQDAITEGAVPPGLVPFLDRWEKVCAEHGREDAWNDDGKDLAVELVAWIDKRIVELSAMQRAGTRSGYGLDQIQATFDALWSLRPAVQVFAEPRLLDRSRSVERQKTQHRAIARRFDLSEEARATLSYFSSATVMSATLTGLPLRQLGIEDVPSVIADPPFDLAHHRIAYETATLPVRDPHTHKYLAHGWSPNELGWLVHYAGGGALVVATSHDQKHRAAEALRGFGWRVGEQANGTEGLDVLVDQLRRGEIQVLVGTDGVGTGVDIPGWALRLVVLLSWPNPNVFVDPHLRAFANRAKDMGEDPWATDFSLRAELSVRQAVGRLVRGPDDVGVVACLEPRRAYHTAWERLVRPSPVVRDLTAVGAFLADPKR